MDALESLCAGSAGVFLSVDACRAIDRQIERAIEQAARRAADMVATRPIDPAVKWPMTYAEFRERYHVSEPTIRKWAKDEEIRIEQVGGRRYIYPQNGFVEQTTNNQ